MRLLKYEDGHLTIASFDDNAIPPYAILSHTWGADAEEVTFADLATGDSKAKRGYKKIHLCGQQARQDGLQYFWVDTCCIDKTDKAELSLAIRSMFRWYQNAMKCYVYLSDVSIRKGNVGDTLAESTWEPAFRSSRWFMRGWTLQELLAPSIVEFFSQEGKKLGDKLSLKSLIHKVTGISLEVLDGAPLSQFSVNERLRWKEGRVTKREEDGAYSLQGILGVELAPVYGEGAAGAFRRLMDEIDISTRCVQDMHSTDPRDDKKRIQEDKGGLLADSYHWVLDNVTFQQWRDDAQSRLLWVKGDPGKGKTMLLCGIINELHSSLPETTLLAYFFCQATDARINNATAVLRGLLYMLVSRQPSLTSYVRKKHDHAGKALFEDANALVAMTEIFVDVLQDPSLSTTYLVIDALDECVTHLLKLLDFIAKLSAFSRVKWIVSSRNWPEIGKQLEQAGHEVRLSLELNRESVSAAVDVFIQHKVSQLARKKKYDKQTQDAVLERLMSSAEGTFLWVALVCRDLEVTARRNVLKKLDTFPPGLNALYERMMQQISMSDDADLCKKVLALVVLVYRPITLQELMALAEPLEDMADEAEVQEIIGLCGSFLTLREATVYFVHQSAKDYLLTNALDQIFPSGREEVHYIIFSRSLLVMSRILKRDIYSLGALGCPIERVTDPDPDPLAAVRYSCTYWVDHFCDWNSNSYADHKLKLHSRSAIDDFVRKRYLHWLEALSLIGKISHGEVSMTRLKRLIQERTDDPALIELIQDALRFIMYHRRAIEISPLQAYASALIFSPAHSLIKGLFKGDEKPKYITMKPNITDRWSPCLKTFEGHSSMVCSVASSHDSERLASASDDGTVKIWDISCGECLQMLEGHSSWVNSVAFSHNSAWLVSASGDQTVKIWDGSSGSCLRTLKGHSDSVRSVAFSHDSALLASASDDRTVKIWDSSNGECLRTLKDHSDSVRSVAFSHDSARLASASNDWMIKIWNANNGECLQTLKGHNDLVRSVAFSHDSARLASGSDNRTVKIWDVSGGECLQTLEGHTDSVRSVAFLSDAAQLASASDDWTIKIWDASSGDCPKGLEQHTSLVYSVTFSHNSALLASASHDWTVKIWDVNSVRCLQTLKGHSSYVLSAAFSKYSTRLASGSADNTVKIWDVSSGDCVQTFKEHDSWVNLVVFSHDSTRLASASADNMVKIWDVSSGNCLQTLNIGKAVFDISVDTTGFFLHTEVGTTAVVAPSAPYITPTVVDPERTRYQGGGISSDGTWITHNSENVVWIPSEYRPSSWDVSGTMIGIGVGSGKVWICNFEIDDS